MAAPEGDAELLDWEQGTGESSSSLPPFCGDRLEVQRRVQERLARRNDQPCFQRRLAGHLQRMPPRYLADVDADDKAEDVMRHWSLLDECADPDKRPVVYARHVKSITLPAGYEGSSNEQPGIASCSCSSVVIPLHEIIFCSPDKPKLLCRLAAVLEEVGLHIREGHLYCTVDGYCLTLFFVDGWHTEETDGLITKVYKALTLKNECGANANKGGNAAS